MKKHNDLYLSEIDNIASLTGYSIREFNKYLFRLSGFNNNVINILYSITPILILINTGFTLVYLLVKFFWSSFKSIFKRRIYLQDNVEYFLFFTPLLYNRSKSANLFSISKYWIIGPNIDEINYNLAGKILIHHYDLLNAKDYFKILFLSFKTTLTYLENYKCLYPIYKTWTYYEVKLALEDKINNSTIYFSNQSDRWALLFDNISSKKKVLIQHGVAPNTNGVPHKLKNIDLFYSISDKTWKDAYRTILKCKPDLKIMESTILLTPMESHKFKILIISYITNFDIERKIIENLQFEDVQLYVKKHPSLKNDKCYIDLMEKYKFNYVQDNIFPKVDFVISYYSTLAYEYESFNIPIYQYNSINDFNMIDLLQIIDKIRKQ